jgi:pimeloyl-ACP methyl ester carboxylesterase
MIRPLKTAIMALIVAALPYISAAQSVRAGKTSTGIAYDVQGSGPFVVLISGSNLDRRMWDREAGWLSKAYTVVRYDLRAHGQSESTVGGQAFSNLGDLVAVLDELKIARTSIIGLSAGATIALDAAVNIPDRVDRIVLSGPGISGYVPKQPPPFSSDLIAALKAGSYRTVSELLLATPIFASPPASRPLVRQMVIDAERMWTIDRKLMTGSPVNAIDRLESVKAPTLILIGDRDEATSEQAEILSKRVPGAEIVRVQGGGHLLNFTSPGEFDSAVAKFLAR